MYGLASAGFLAVGADAGLEFGGGFVGAAFLAGNFGFGGDELAPEGFCQDGLRQFVGAFRCGFNM